MIASKLILEAKMVLPKNLSKYMKNWRARMQIKTRVIKSENLSNTSDLQFNIASSIHIKKQRENTALMNWGDIWQLAKDELTTILGFQIFMNPTACQGQIKLPFISFLIWIFSGLLCQGACTSFKVLYLNLDAKHCAGYLHYNWVLNIFSNNL